MAFSNTLTGFFIFYLIILSIFLLLNITNYSLDTLEHYTLFSHNISERTIIKYDSYYATGNIIYVNLTNEGETQVRIMNLKYYMDIIIVYENNESNKVIERIPYGKTISVSYWIISNTYGDFINPITNSTGIWDPGEKIEIKISLSYPLSQEQRFFIVVCLRNGYRLFISSNN